MAAIASLGAAIIHFAVIPTHWQEWVPAGLFFLSVALFQLTWAMWVLIRPSSSVLAAGVMVNLGTIAIWALSRTAGAPFGPRAGEPELVHGADLCALLLEIYVVMGAGWVWYRGQQRDLIPAFANAIVLVGAGAVIALASTVGVASGLQHDHHAPAGADSDHHGFGTTGQSDDHHDHPAPPAAEPVSTPVAPAPVEAPAPTEAAPAAPEPSHDDHGEHHHD